ncbi:hypothetical protein [Rhodohalobacter mucosus]|uniref:Uncharacterized protein n=1 Tax=Rhodohalobacter mucosus TaxID=2079485 RepID=A0A316TMJ4_9BACT|nr:hypothetical protein [Rhodohalobacter mucosus]PWN05640.1 hypothetical protein DDZ15_13665 [Rhodohalobacter mucosus]
MKRTKRRPKFDWYNAVISDVKRQKKDSVENKKQKQKEYFASIYDRPKEVQFKDKEEMNMVKHIYLPKLDQDWNFGRYKNAVAIYPVLCCRADFRDDTKWVRISRENIGKLAGIWPGAVDKGIIRLVNVMFNIKDEIPVPFLQVREWKDGKRRGHEYLPAFYRYGSEKLDPHKWATEFITFHSCIIDSGVWAKLSRKAKALYWAMRSKAFFDRDAYQQIEGIRIKTLDEVYDNELYNSETLELDTKKYSDRKWDICNTTLKELFQLARTPYTDTREIVSELVDLGLVERVHQTKPIFKVYLRPKFLYDG